MTFREELETIQEAIDWVGDRTEQQAWEECNRADWMILWAASSGWGTPEQYAHVAILCATQFKQSERWLRWAKAWLDVTDRSNASAVEVWAEESKSADDRAAEASWAEVAASWAAAWAAGAAAGAAALALAALGVSAEAVVAWAVLAVWWADLAESKAESLNRHMADIVREHIEPDWR